jgi:myo-inositol-1(or 4)-monophosphatase
MIATGIPVLDWAGREMGYARQLDRVAGAVAGIRRMGTASLDFAYVAAGRFEGFWEYGLKPWDMAAGIVLVREAGGLVGRLDGEADLLAPGTIVVGNPAIQPRLIELLQGA